jgi:hypothetical protein
MLPPRHSVTLKPSSLSSPVNSRLIPPSREPHAAWILIQEVSSLMIVPKLRVLRPPPEVSVLGVPQCVIHIVEKEACVVTYFPCIGSHTHATGCPERFTPSMCPERWSPILTDSSNKRLKVEMEERRTLPAPYLVMSVTRPLSLFGFTTVKNKQH